MFKKLFENLPPFVYQKAFWEALTTAVAGVLGLCAFFGWLPAAWAVTGTVLLTWVYAVLKFFNIEPQFRTFKSVKRMAKRAKK